MMQSESKAKLSKSRGRVVAQPKAGRVEQAGRHVAGKLEALSHTTNIENWLFVVKMK